MTPPKQELSEKDFINESYSKNPFPFWLWLFLVTAFTAIIWGSSSWYFSKLGHLMQSSPFLQVTNRELSLFLWQNPEFMRVNAKDKNGYLPGFKYVDKVTMELGDADQFVVAPPELLFRYHTWHRLVSQEFSPRPIPAKEFIDFLNYVEEWKPLNWPAAPEGYIKFVEGLSKEKGDEDLSHQPLTVLPQEVRLAFQGWRNFFKEGDAINLLQPTYGELTQFLKTSPHYARNYWRNIVETLRPNYLKTYTFGKFEPDEKVPDDQLSSFLKVALYNFFQSTTAKPAS